MANHSLKKGRAAPLHGNIGPIIGVLKLGLALATIGVLGKLSAKLAAQGPKAGFGGSSFAGPRASTAIPSGNARPVFATQRNGFAGPRNPGSGPSTPRPR